jgi:hypothetical protein
MKSTGADIDDGKVGEDERRAWVEQRGSLGVG